jgi:hypothetical protein
MIRSLAPLRGVGNKYLKALKSEKIRSTFKTIFIATFVGLLNEAAYPTKRLIQHF